MSGWDAWRDSLTAQKTVSDVAICGLDGSTWTTTPGFNVQVAEIQSIVRGFKESSGLTSGGIFINGTKYMFVQGDDTQLQGRKGGSGISIAKASKCMVIATYAEGFLGDQTADMLFNFRRLNFTSTTNGEGIQHDHDLG